MSNQEERIWLSLAHMGGEEQQFIKKAFDDNWIVPLGPNVDGFEEDLKKYLNEDVYVAALSAGTASIHLGLILLGVGAGDEVICQSFTFSASANPIVYQGATPVFVDSEEDSWNMSPGHLEAAIKDRLAKGEKPKAILVVHLYGMPAKMDAICEIANRYNIPILEDAAEALGSSHRGRMCGTMGEFGVLSFNGNKIITTSGGGALVSRSEEYNKKAKFLATQAREPMPYYYHKEIGYNYRMSNVVAGIGRGQMLVLPERVQQRRSNHQFYKEQLAGIDAISFHSEPNDDYFSNYWLTCILIDPAKSNISPEKLRLALEEVNIESRPLWKPMHSQPVFENCPFYGDSTSEQLFERGLCLPSGSSLTRENLRRVCERIKEILSHNI